MCYYYFIGITVHTYMHMDILLYCYSVGLIRYNYVCFTLQHGWHFLCTYVLLYNVYGYVLVLPRAFCYFISHILFAASLISFSIIILCMYFSIPLVVLRATIIIMYAFNLISSLPTDFCAVCFLWVSGVSSESCSNWGLKVLLMMWRWWWWMAR